jgi:hypothetical protein
LGTSRVAQAKPLAQKLIDPKRVGSLGVYLFAILIRLEKEPT